MCLAVPNSWVLRHLREKKSCPNISTAQVYCAQFLGVFCPSGFAICKHQIGCIPCPEHGKSVFILCRRLPPLWRHGASPHSHCSAASPLLSGLCCCMSPGADVSGAQTADLHMALCLRRTRCKTHSSGKNCALSFLPTCKRVQVVVMYSLGFSRQIIFTYLYLYLPFLVKHQNSGYLSRFKE